MDYSIEVLPAHCSDFLSAHQKVEDQLPKQSFEVFVPHINGTAYLDVLSDCEILLEHGYSVIPHLAVRNLQASEDLDKISQKINQLKLTKFLFLGGDSRTFVHFDSVMALLQSSWVESLTIDTCCFATFPDGHLHLKDRSREHAELQKKIDWAQTRGMAVRLMTQIGFDAQSFIEHGNQLKLHGIEAPLHGGFVADCKFSKLLKIATTVGVDNAISFLKKNNLIKLFGSYNSDSFIRPLIEQSVIAGVHAYPFGNYDDALKKGIAYQQIKTVLEAQKTV